MNIALSLYYYVTVRDKKGHSGTIGPQGELGDPGPVGKCASNCRESLCTDAIIAAITEYIGKLDPEKPIKLNNVYIKQKIKSLCLSEQFAELVPYKGATNLIKYTTEIWKNWIDLLFNAGGRTYFETIGAEMEWEWLTDNPFEEIKKYDVFYWGLSDDYRPNIIKKCYTKEGTKQQQQQQQQQQGGDKPLITGPELLQTTTSNNMTYIGQIRSVNSATGTEYIATVWRPKKITYQSIPYFPLGDIVAGPFAPYSDANAITMQRIRYSDLQLNNTIKSPIIAAMLVGNGSSSSNGAAYLTAPIDYTLIWTNTTSIWFWRPIPESAEYIAMGDIATTTAAKPISKSAAAPVRCILKSLCIPIASTIAAQQSLGERSHLRQQTLWKTSGATTSHSTATILGFTSIDVRKSVSAAAPPSAANSYNLFRIVPFGTTSIPPSDVDAAFYEIKTVYYDTNVQPGKLHGRPYAGKDNKYYGRGFLKSRLVKQSKYSILAYLNLKPIMHAYQGDVKIELENHTGFDLSNSYLVKYKGQCLEVQSNNSVISAARNYNEYKQCFRIDMTGRNAGEFQLVHLYTEMLLDAEGGHFKIVSNESKHTQWQFNDSNSNSTTGGIGGIGGDFASLMTAGDATKKK
jgi:hypothetical protein